MEIELLVAQYTNTDCGMVAVSGIRPRANIRRNCPKQGREERNSGCESGCGCGCESGCKSGCA